MTVEVESDYQSITLQKKVRFLQRPEVYPERTDLVQTKETHMSWLFLADRFVYKLKKPVRREFLDYSTVAARHYFCKEEIRLNRRLAGPVYIGTVPLTLSQAGRLQLGGDGTIVDWLVKMKRLPAERMLDCAIRNRTVTKEDIRLLVIRLFRFYRQLTPVSMTPGHYLDRLRERIEENRRELTLTQYGLTDGQVEGIHAAQAELLDCFPGIFTARVNMIVEGHGDLRPEHICLLPEPVIIDCLEFERDFRILDPAEELAFLTLECELLGAVNLGRQIMELYCEASGDRLPELLLYYYKSYRACVRAKLALWHIAEADDAEIAAHWRQRAREYITSAEHYSSLFR